jgi:DNA polymerase-3 subunit delta
MKLALRDAARLWVAPPETWPGLLIFGADPMRVADRRAEAAAALTGPGAEAEMRLARLGAADLRADPAALLDAVKAQGFFPGPRAVVLDGAGDAHAPALAATLDAWQAGDARLIVTAGQLKAGGGLRKLFEGHRTAHALALYDDPPGRDEVAAMLRAAGLMPPDRPAPDRAAMDELMALAAALDPGDLRQTIEKLALYKLSEPGPLLPSDLAACAPASTEAELDDALHAVAEGRAGDLAPLNRRLEAQGTAPVRLCIAAGGHFRQLHALAADPASAARRLAAVRHIRTRDRLQAQSRRWSLARLETALAILLEADLALRSSARVPAMPLLERALLRIARLAAAPR